MVPVGSAAGELFHHEAGAAAGDMRDDRSSPVDFRDQAQIDCEREVNLLSLTQAEILGLDEYAVCTQIFSFANPAFSSRHDDVNRRSCSVAGVQATLHSYQPL